MWRAAGVDELAGTKGLLRAFSKWADVENACNRWAERMRAARAMRWVPA